MADKKNEIPESARLNMENAEKDRRVKNEYAAYEEYLKQEKKDNEAPRKALSDAASTAAKYVKDKASAFGKATGLYAKGGSVSSASSRGDGCAIRGKTKGRIV
jgi:hypothetical protein